MKVVSLLSKNNYDAYSNEHLIRLYQEGDSEVKDYFFERNKALIYGLVKRYQNMHNREELFQIGCIGFVKAFNQFNLAYEVKFSTYAVPIILGEIKKYFRDEGSLHIARSLKENYMKILQAKDVLSQMYLKEPTIQEIATHLSLPLEDVVLSLEANCFVSSLDEVVHVSEHNDLLLMDVCEDQKAKVDSSLKVALQDEMQALNKQEKQILYFRYFKDLKQNEIARELSISQVQVSRIEKRALLKLHKKFK